MTDHAERRAAIRSACFNPGGFVRRDRTRSDVYRGSWDYEELWLWQARAVEAALDALAPETRTP